MPIQEILVRSITERHRRLTIRHVDGSEQVYDVTASTCSCNVPQTLGYRCIHQRLVDAAGELTPGTTYHFPLS